MPQPEGKYITQGVFGKILFLFVFFSRPIPQSIKGVRLDWKHNSVQVKNFNCIEEAHVQILRAERFRRAGLQKALPLLELFVARMSGSHLMDGGSMATRLLLALA